MYAISSIIKLTLIGIWSILSILIATIVYFLCFQPNVMLFLAKHLWARPMLVLLGGRVKVYGKEKLKKGEHYLIIANHCSYSDIPALFRSLDFYLYFIAKEELRKVPLLGWYMVKSGMIFIDRKNKSKAKSSLEAAGQLIKMGKSVVIFPEGTTSKDGSVGPFKKGGIHLAHESQSTILPVRITGTHRLWPSIKMLNLRAGKVEVIIGEPIYYKDYQNKNPEHFLEDLRKEIVELTN